MKNKLKQVIKKRNDHVMDFLTRTPTLRNVTATCRNKDIYKYFFFLSITKGTISTNNTLADKLYLFLDLELLYCVFA